MRKKIPVLTFLALSELLVMSLWFSASAVVPQLTIEWALTQGQQAWLTMSVQLGFVAGAFAAALFNIPDRFSTHSLIAFSAIAGAAANAMVVVAGSAFAATVALRFLTGVFLAGVYPPGMKLMATWCREDRGLWIGILVGALTFGSAVPHFLNAIPLGGEAGMPPWRSVLIATSGLSVVGGMSCLLLVREGPLHTGRAPFNWRFIREALSYRPTRLANFGYFGHMWELYAVWTWVPVMLITSYAAADLSVQAARLAGFCVVAVGALGCIAGGYFSDRIGRTVVTTVSLVVSGICCVIAGFLISNPTLLTILCLIWGFAVVADSAQFSTAVSELTDPRYVGTALTVQTSIGFLLTIVTIRGVPLLVDWIGWEFALVPLVLGPVFGARSMLLLRAMPEAAKMASGRR